MVVSGLLLFLVFSVMMLLVLLFGASAYKNITTSLEQQYRERTCLNYIAAKVRNCDSAGKVYITDVPGVPALAMDEGTGDIVYTTYIYYYNGSLYELYIEKDSQFSPSDGFSILPLDDVAIEQMTDSLFKVECTANGRTAEILINTSSSEGEVL